MTTDTPDEILRRIRLAEFPPDMPLSRALAQWIAEQRRSEDISNAPGLVARLAVAIIELEHRLGSGPPRIRQDEHMWIDLDHGGMQYRINLDKVTHISTKQAAIEGQGSFTLTTLHLTTGDEITVEKDFSEVVGKMQDPVV